MKKLSFIFVTAMILSLMIGNINSIQAITMGNISGTITDLGLNPLQNIEVNIHNAENGIVVATAVTDSNGQYDSGPLPDGDYRVHVLGVNSFCSESIVNVVSENTVTVDLSFDPPGPSLVEPYEVLVSGQVSDSSGLSPIEGITVTLLTEDDADPLVSVTTDFAGNYIVDRLEISSSFTVRFSDSLGNYISEYSGSDGADDFCSASTFDFFDMPLVLDEQMVELILTPSEQTEELIAETNDIGLPEEVAETLVSPLNQASELLDDNNVNNDRAACGKLNAFIKQVEAKNGKNLTSEQASQLTDSAVAVKSSIDC